MIVTIDGPAGSGKSTAARELAARLGFCFLDTGAMYRAVTLACLRQGIELTDEAAVGGVARRLEIRLEGGRVYADGEDVTVAIRANDVTQGTRFVAANTVVRQTLVELQRRCAAGIDVVTEGRDQGTVVFPDAACKFYLTADPTERAHRRRRDLAALGENVPVEVLLAQLADRDQRDADRTVGPLKPAADAIHVDTSGLEREEVVSRLEELVRSRMPTRA